MARKKRRGRPTGSKNKKTAAKRAAKSKGIKSNKRTKGKATKAKKLNQIPLPILEKRLLKLSRIVKQRQ